MRLLAITCAFLGLLRTHASPLFGIDGIGAHVEKISPSGHFDNPDIQRRALRFLNQATAPFAVNGSTLPNITWDVGESYAGLLPISREKNETRKLFFWFFPSYDSKPRDEIVVWLNGGPGCSSMEGLLTELGPIDWPPGMDFPAPNPLTWLNLTNVVWIDQPLGVGYSQGEPDIETEYELAAEFIGFWRNFVELFCMENWRTYLTGESYAGVYIPYIAGAFIGAGETTYYNLVGVHINAAVIGDGNLQMVMPLPAYATYYNSVLGLNESSLNDLITRADECGFTSYLDDHLVYPPPQEPFAQFGSADGELTDEQCDIWLPLRAAAELVNPCFNIYHITDSCPWPSSPIGSDNPYIDPTTEKPTWFSQSDVRKALHVPPSADRWTRCGPRVFRNRTDGSLALGDPYSPPPASTDLLTRMIEYTSSVIIGSGGLDMLIPTNGTLLILQQTEWQGMLGFQRAPDSPFYSPYPIKSAEAVGSTTAGIVGTWGRERGLTFYEVKLAGHELPRYAPGPSFRAMELLLGRISSLGEVGDFTTMSSGVDGRSAGRA